MPPTESQILSQTLLPPSALSSILPLTKFTSLFPSTLQTSPQIPVLYRTLQLQRGLDLDAIRQNIAAEVVRGREQVRALARSRARDARDQGLELDGGDLGSGDGVLTGTTGRRGVHSGKSLCEGLEDVQEELQLEVERLEDEVRRLIVERERIVDGLGGLEMDAIRDLDLKDLTVGVDRVSRNAKQ